MPGVVERSVTRPVRERPSYRVAGPWVYNAGRRTGAGKDLAGVEL
jgi:hypothetical protein